MSASTQVCWLFVCVVVPVFLLRICRIGRRERGLPPGPPTTPILGNILQFPREYPHIRFTEWAKQYGGIFSLKLGPGTVVVISDPRISRELLEVRSASTSSRPPLHFDDLITGGRHLVLMPNTPEWKRVRRIAVTEILTESACARNLPIQAAEATQVMHDFLKDPQHFIDHIERYSNSVITSVLVGTRSPRSSSPAIPAFFAAVHKLAALLEIGAHPPVDLVPLLKYVPERWAPWKTRCAELRAMQRELYFGSIERSVERIAADRRNGCFLESVLDKYDWHGADREMIGYLCGALLEAGSETTATFLLTFIAFMVNHPEVQAMARLEIDQVLGSGSAPVLGDIDRLPYVQAIIKEVLRLRPPVQMGVPHYSTENEMVAGYLIPKDTMIIANLWAINHDARAFEEPDKFDPGRFLRSEFGTKPGADDTGRRHDMAFGFGRRLCVGIRLAEASIALNVMNLLWAFEFRPATDPVTQKPIAVDMDNYAKGMALTPLPFVCDIRVRSAEHAAVIEDEFADARGTFEHFEQFEHELSAEGAAAFKQAQGAWVENPRAVV